MPTDFYSLPLELRQKILLNSFEEPLANDIAFNANLSRLKQILDGINTAAAKPFFHFAPHISAWAHTLKSTHPTINGDLEFVMRTTLKAVEAAPRYTSPKSRLAYMGECENTSAPPSDQDAHQLHLSANGATP
ncbi:hypothetical protein BLS_000928 [Venturia inaequalis]|uniref:Uncharacterized protein n=1 Tax=Venturia inaequalis TaxID=5025 RepID=A0A8H3YLI6_VENIN|nr:hypothetical protein BLS_000928 [Venturia inaequalis]